MPEEAKGPDPVSPSPEGAEQPTQKAPAASPAAAAAKPDPVDPASPAKPADTVAASPAAKPADAKPVAPAAAKPPAPAAAKPAAPAKPAGPQPEPWNSDLVAKFKNQYGSGIREANTYLGQKYLLVDSGIVFDILSRMLEDEQYDYCVDITAVHWPKREQPFDIIYILYSFPHNERVRIKAQIADGQPVPSARPPVAHCELAGARSIRHVRHRVRRPSRHAAHPLPDEWRVPAAQGLRHSAAGQRVGAENLGIESGQ